MTAEENFQASSDSFVTEAVKPDGTQTEYTSGTTGAEFGLVGENTGGWLKLILLTPITPPANTALGRFRHENITMRVEAGKKLVAYMGDDRRPHLEICQLGTVSSPTSKENSALFEDGILYVAVTILTVPQWIPLELNANTNPTSVGSGLSGNCCIAYQKWAFFTTQA